jgi:hypothetical protein
VDAATLSTAADWAAIAAAVFAFLLLVAGAARWLWVRWDATEIDHALHADSGPAPVIVEHPGGGVVVVRVGLNLTNGSSVPISHQIVRFDIRVGDWDNPLTMSVAREDISPGQTKGWYREQMSVRVADLPATITFDYDIHYGRHQRRARRHITGILSFSLDMTAPGQITAAFFQHLQPERDEKLARGGSAGATTPLTTEG